MNRYSFLRWVRSGAAGAIRDEEGSGRGEPRARISIEVEFGSGLYPRRELALHGPGDVVGLTGAQIIRRFPEPGSLTVGTDAFAHVELDDPDLPWRYTPFREQTAADSGPGLPRQGTLAPWLCLVVVERRPGVSYGLRPGDPLPVLRIADRVDDELPPPGEVHAWAHVQLIGDLPDDLGEVIDRQPERVLARLVAPRLLEPDTPYLACVVPVFETGRQAGLGEPVTELPPRCGVS